MKTSVKIGAGLALALAFFGSYSLASLVLDRAPPITYEGARALQPEVGRGGTLDVEFQVFRTRICSAVTRRWLVDSEGTRHAIPSYTVGVKLLAGRETYQRSITIPLAAALGPAWYEVSLDYYCNVFHRIGWPINVTSPPVPFLIRP